MFENKTQRKRVDTRKLMDYLRFYDGQRPFTRIDSGVSEKGVNSFVS